MEGSRHRPKIQDTGPCQTTHCDGQAESTLTCCRKCPSNLLGPLKQAQPKDMILHSESDFLADPTPWGHGTFDCKGLPGIPLLGLDSGHFEATDVSHSARMQRIWDDSERLRL